MTTVDLLPDVQKLVRTYLLTLTDITSLVGTRVTTRSRGEFPELVLQRIGGIPSVRQRLDSARIQVDSYGNTEGEASRLARVARTALHLMPGYVSDVAVCTGVDDDLGLAWIPDTTRKPETPRFIFGVVIHAHNI
jgi:hypothetical protein